MPENLLRSKTANAAQQNCKRCAAKLQTLRKSGLTFAAEAGTQRMRNVINKNITEENKIEYVAFVENYIDITTNIIINRAKEIVKKLKMNGLVNEEEAIIRLMDRECENKSDVFPVEWKKDGSLSSRSSTMSAEQLRNISEFVSAKIKNIGKSYLPF